MSNFCHVLRKLLLTNRNLTGNNMIENDFCCSCPKYFGNRSDGKLRIFMSCKQAERA